MKPSQLLRGLTPGRSGRTPSGPVGVAGPRIREDEAFVVIRDAIVVVLEVPAAGVTRSTRLVEDLRADSLALVEIVELVEERLAEGWPGLIPTPFRFEDAGLEHLRTVGDAVTYVVTRL